MPDRPTSTPGFYLSRLKKDGAPVPIKVWLEDGDRDPDTGEILSDQILRGKIGDTPFDPFGPLAPGKMIDFRDTAWSVTRDVYEQWMVRGHNPDEPASRPHESVDLSKAPPIF